MDPNGSDPGGMCQLTQNQANVRLKKDHKVDIKTVGEAIQGKARTD